MTDRELMQEALDALNNFDKGNHGMRWQVPLIKALRARLSQPEQEPVAWISHNAGLYHGKPDESLNPLPLYTDPPQANRFNPDWDALPVMVEEQQRMAKRIEELETQLGEAMWGYGEWRRKAEISSALCTRQGIRLMEYESQEAKKPVAWFVYIPSQQCGEYFDSEDDDGLVDWMTNYPDAELTKLYTAPPKREWVGLSDKEIADCFEMSMFGTCQAIEAKLKEKNT